MNHKFYGDKDENVNANKSELIMRIPFQKTIGERDPVSQHLFKVNQFYQDVTDENKKTAFKADVYSTEFLNFLPKLLEEVQESISEVHILD